MHRGLEIYLIAMDKDEAASLSGSIAIYAASDEFDEFIEYLKDHKL